MKVVYVAGPIGSESFERSLRNCYCATEVALRLSRAGLAVICVHALAAMEIAQQGGESTPYRRKQVLDQDIDILARCDAVVLVTENYAASSGTKAEVAHARVLGIPVFTEAEAIEWMRSERDASDKARTAP